MNVKEAIEEQKKEFRRFVVCSAIRRNHDIILGVRHFDKFMRAHIEATGKGFGFLVVLLMDT